VNRGVGVLIGIVVGWIASVIFNAGSSRLVHLRLARFDEGLAKSLPWLLVILAGAAVLGLLGVFARQVPGAVFGAGLYLTAIGVLLVVLPIRTAMDLSHTVFDLIERRSYGYPLNGWPIFVGLALLGAGLGALRPARSPQVQPQQQYPAANLPPGQFPG
jgi:hypothetical protein